MSQLRWLQIGFFFKRCRRLSSKVYPIKESIKKYEIHVHTIDYIKNKSTTKYIENAVVSATTAPDKRNIC